MTLNLSLSQVSNNAEQQAEILISLPECDFSCYLLQSSQTLLERQGYVRHLPLAVNHVKLMVAYNKCLDY